jgi:hypothetical protein
VGLSFVGTTAGMIVSLYQMGILRRLPDLPSGIFDATKVDRSTYAYRRMQTPDALLMVASYAATAILAGAGGKDRARDNPAPPIALAAKTLYDVLIALKLGREEWQENRALCGYCQSRHRGVADLRGHRGARGHQAVEQVVASLSNDNPPATHRLPRQTAIAAE